MNTKHTPGPWTYLHSNGGNLEIKSGEIHIVNGCGCCDSPWLGGNAEADARLLAAAPDLLEALKSTLLELHYCSQQLVSSGWTEGTTVRKAIDGAKVAIAKATGGKT